MRHARLQRKGEVEINGLSPIPYGSPLKLLGFTEGAARPWKVCVFDSAPRFEDVSVSGEAFVGANLVVIGKGTRRNGEFVCRAVPASELDAQADRLENGILAMLLGVGRE